MYSKCIAIVPKFVKYIRIHLSVMKVTDVPTAPCLYICIFGI